MFIFLTKTDRLVQILKSKQRQILARPIYHLCLGKYVLSLFHPNNPILYDNSLQILYIQVNVSRKHC